MNEFKALELANSAWAFAALNLLDEKLCRTLAREAEWWVSEGNAQGLSQLHQRALSRLRAGLLKLL